MSVFGKVYIKDKKRRQGDFQFFMHDFIDICIKEGLCAKADIFPSYKWHIRAAVREILWRLKILINKLVNNTGSNKDGIIITANGCTIKDETFPYYFKYDIIPMLWDVWGFSWERMYKAFKVLNVRIVFVSSRQVTDMINKESDVKAFWIPEGIDTSHYQRGDRLRNRPFDVLELGRQMGCYHLCLKEMLQKKMINKLTTSNISQEGTLDNKNVAFTNEELYEMMPKYKIMICFPQCDTNPQRAGQIETLTQRYWEAMLSGCLMLGRAPQELIDLIGYNPVVNIDWSSPETQMTSIIENIDNYQDLVDKNYISAKKHAPWEKRIPLIKQYLKEADYYI